MEPRPRLITFRARETNRSVVAWESFSAFGPPAFPRMSSPMAGRSIAVGRLGTPPGSVVDAGWSTREAVTRPQRVGRQAARGLAAEEAREEGGSAPPHGLT